MLVTELNRYYIFNMSFGIECFILPVLDGVSLSGAETIREKITVIRNVYLAYNKKTVTFSKKIYVKRRQR